MRHRVAVLAVLALVGAALPAVARPAATPAGRGYPACVHPYPCGNEWPAGLHGPFAALPVQRVAMASFDGTTLGGYLFRPRLPRGVKAPTVLISSPYDFAPGTPSATDDSEGPIDNLVAHGYAVAEFSVRGTGRSGGCFENKGVNEQHDQYALVEWLARQSWSNGRVGMIGLSYPGTTPNEAAVENPPHLDAIIVEGQISDVFTEMFTPNGAMYSYGATDEVGRRTLVGVSPVAQADDPAAMPRIARNKLCPEYLHVETQAEMGQLTDARDGRYWSERRLIDRFPSVTAAVFGAHGLHDLSHPFQEDPVWQALRRAPKHMLLGQWGHESPGSGGVKDWPAQVLGWFDFWLKGVGGVPAAVGKVDYQDGTGAWHHTTSWPPADSHDEVLYLDGAHATLAPRPVAGSATFLAAQLPGTTSTPVSADGWPACVAPTGTSLAYASPVLRHAVALAGNPMAYLRLSVDQPGGLVAVGLYDVPPSGCGGARLLSSGAADLRFHRGNDVGVDFPVGRATPVRVDLTDLADTVAAGHRLVVVVSGGELTTPTEPATQAADQRYSHWNDGYVPNVTVVGTTEVTASQVVLPVRGSGLGGGRPAVRYPPRPHVPAQPR